MLCEKVKNFAKFTWKHLCQSLFFNKVAGLRPQACNFIKKETLAQVFSCKFCEILKNTFFQVTPPLAGVRKVFALEVFLEKGDLKICSKFYRRTPMPKWEFNKFAKHFIEVALWHGCCPANLMHNFRILFSKNLWTAASVYVCYAKCYDWALLYLLISSEFFSNRD